MPASMVALDQYAETQFSFFAPHRRAPGAGGSLVSFDVPDVNAETSQLGNDIHAAPSAGGKSSCACAMGCDSAQGFPALPRGCVRRKSDCRTNPSQCSLESGQV